MSTQFVLVFNRMADCFLENSMAHGWWEGDPSDGEKVALMHSELSEMLEALRARNPPSPKALVKSDGQPLTCVEEEAADVVIRLAEWCAHQGHDLGAAIVAKHEYNKTRPHRHGDKAF